MTSRLSQLYRLFLKFLPGEFRDEYGGEMARLFRDRCRLKHSSKCHRSWPKGRERWHFG
jgi:hypothetical protein